MEVGLVDNDFIVWTFDLIPAEFAVMLKLKVRHDVTSLAK